MRGVEPNLIANKQNQYGKTTGKYVSDKEISAILTEALRNMLSDLNYKVAEGGGEIILTGEILKFEQNILQGFWSGQLEGNVQVNLRLLNTRTNTILWNEIISGRGNMSGIQFVTDDKRKEVTKKTFDSLMTNIANSPTFKTAIERGSSQ
jgi:curli biogenesis system outer membrane secretion channel CsgG